MGKLRRWKGDMGGEAWPKSLEMHHCVILKQVMGLGLEMKSSNTHKHNKQTNINTHKEGLVKGR